MKKIRMIRLSLIACLFPLTAFAGAGQPVQQGEQTQQEEQSNLGKPVQQPDVQPTAEERSMFQAIHMINVSELNAALVAFSRNPSSEVREYAWDLFLGHVRNEEKLIQFATRYDIDLSLDKPAFADATSSSDAMLAGLKGATDEEFEQLFITSMITSHGDALSRLEALGQSIVIDEFKTYLNDTIADIKVHEAAAQSVLQSIEPAVNQPVTGQPVTGQPVTGQPVTGQPVTGQPVE